MVHYTVARDIRLDDATAKLGNQVFKAEYTKTYIEDEEAHFEIKCKGDSEISIPHNKNDIPEALSVKLYNNNATISIDRAFIKRLDDGIIEGVGLNGTVDFHEK